MTRDVIRDLPAEVLAVRGIVELLLSFDDCFPLDELYDALQEDEDARRVAGDLLGEWSASQATFMQHFIIRFDEKYRATEAELEDAPGSVSMSQRRFSVRSVLDWFRAGGRRFRLGRLAGR